MSHAWAGSGSPAAAAPLWLTGVIVIVVLVLAFQIPFVTPSPIIADDLGPLGYPPLILYRACCCLVVVAVACRGAGTTRCILLCIYPQAMCCVHPLMDLVGCLISGF